MLASREAIEAARNGEWLESVETKRMSSRHGYRRMCAEAGKTKEVVEEEATPCDGKDQKAEGGNLGWW